MSIINFIQKVSVGAGTRGFCIGTNGAGAEE